MKVSEGTVIVTGASRGIGLATAEAILGRGGRVIAVARDQARLQALGKKYPERVHALVADLREIEQVEELLAQAVDAFAGVDGLVNNAGVLHYQEVGGITQEALRSMLDVNLAAPLFWMQAIQPHLKGRGGAIVNVSSTASIRAVQGLSGYSASKAALNALTRSFARALAPDGIRVNAVLPAVIETDMVKAPRTTLGEGALSEDEARLRAEEHFATLREQHLLGRLGTPQDVAEAVLSLLDHPWQTGSLLLLDGGLTLST